MITLGIETSTLTGSVALLVDGNLRGEITLSVSVQHSERLMPAIDQLLRDCSIPSEGIDLYAVSQGPGSFTGLRIGLAAAQGFSLAHQKPLVGVSSLQALAMNGFYFPGLVVPVFDAFRGEVYRGLYKDHGELFAEDRVISPADLVEELKQHQQAILVLGNGLKVCEKILKENFSEDRLQIAPQIFHTPRASQVAFLAQEKFQKQESREPVLPRYLRRPGP